MSTIFPSPPCPARTTSKLDLSQRFHSFLLLLFPRFLFLFFFSNHASLNFFFAGERKYVSSPRDFNDDSPLYILHIFFLENTCKIFLVPRQIFLAFAWVRVYNDRVFQRDIDAMHDAIAIPRFLSAGKDQWFKDFFSLLCANISPRNTAILTFSRDS